MICASVSVSYFDDGTSWISSHLSMLESPNVLLPLFFFILANLI